MSYTKKTWKTGDTITAAALNNLEQGASDNADAIADIEAALPTYVGEKVTRKAAATITPGTADQTIAANQYLTGTQTIKGDANLTAGNIKKGTAIFGVTGTLETGGTGTDTSDATAEAADIMSGKTAYVKGEKVTGTLATPTILRASPSSITEATIRPTTGVGSSYKEITMKASSLTISGKCVVDADNTDIRITAKATEFGDATAADVAEGKTFTSAAGLKVKGTKAASSSLDTSDATASASDILSGKTAYVNGAKVTGTISKKAAATITPGTEDQTIASGQYLSGARTIKGDANLIAANIKKGVSIFGVTGTLESGGGTSLNNCEAYLITSTSQAVNFKNTGGTLKVWGYATQTSSSSWGGGTTTKLLAFDGDKYYTSTTYGSPTATSLSLSLNSDGTISGLPTLASCSLLVTMGV